MLLNVQTERDFRNHPFPRRCFTKQKNESLRADRLIEVHTLPGIVWPGFIAQHTLRRFLGTEANLREQYLRPPSESRLHSKPQLASAYRPDRSAFSFRRECHLILSCALLWWFQLPTLMGTIKHVLSFERLGLCKQNPSTVTSYPCLSRNSRAV